MASRLFDRFVFVDWSAKSAPSTGSNSIWIADGNAAGVSVTNPPTRAKATSFLRQLLLSAVVGDERVLIGLDFPYGYPVRFASALVLPGAGPPWRQTWDELGQLVADDAQNRNNRFAVAAVLNRRLGEEPGPFWGCPESACGPHLSARRGAFPYQARRGIALAEYRVTEACLRARGRQLSSVWKLFTQPTVGSQALLGIPRLARLRDDPGLAHVSTTWPFETGFTTLPGGGSRPLVLHCEIWPGVTDIDLTVHPVRDAAQVIGLVRWASQLDAMGGLGGLFAPGGLSTAQGVTCISEEGWILGA